MENKELKFKTNLNCGGCVAKVQADLDNATDITSWNVDTNNPDKILTVSSNGITAEAVAQIIKSKGFSIESI